VYDISRLGSFIGQTLLSKPDPKQFREAADHFVRALQQRIGWMYGAADPEGNAGTIRHVVWSDFPVCTCGQSASYWNLAVSLNPDSVSRVAMCATCGERFRLGTAAKEQEREYDDLLRRDIAVRKRRPAYVYGRTGRDLWSRPPEPADHDVLDRVRETKLPSSVPIMPLGDAETNWGDLYRAGYHTGMSHAHQFYTRRNLIVVGTAWELSDQYGVMAPALRLLLSAYGATHGTLMSRLVTKRGQPKFVLTGTQSGTLYVSDLPVEKNIILGLRAKTSTLEKAFEELAPLTIDSRYVRESSLQTGLATGSVDYIFTDPPFGDFIPYGEANAIPEAWLGDPTDRAEEVIISQYQGKSVARYEQMLSEFFREAKRILKPAGHLTLVFHASAPETWAAIQRAWERGGFRLLTTSTLNKVQGSFKQVTTEGSVRGDVVILLESGEHDRSTVPAVDVSAFEWIRASGVLAGGHMSPKQAFSAYVRDCLATNSAVISAAEFYRLLGQTTSGA
jgi:hypothetical protein